MARTIYVLGSLNIDFSIEIDNFPKVGETIHCEKLLIGAGGKGANQALALVRNHLNVKMIGAVGNDNYGQGLINNLKANKIDTSNISLKTTGQTGHAFVLRYNENNRIIVDAGVNSLLTVDDVTKALSNANEGEFLLAQLETPLEVARSAFKLAKSKGMITLLNPAPARTLPSDFLIDIDYLLMNEVECEEITKVKPTSKKALLKIRKYLRQTNNNLKAVITCGSEGSYYVDQTTLEKSPAFKIKPLDTTGAGDAFIGAFIYALTEKLNISKALRYANASGALASLKVGAQNAIPTKEEIDEFLSL